MYIVVVSGKWNEGSCLYDDDVAYGPFVTEDEAHTFASAQDRNANVLLLIVLKLD